MEYKKKSYSDIKNSFIFSVHKKSHTSLIISIIAGVVIFGVCLFGAEISLQASLIAGCIVFGLFHLDTFFSERKAQIGIHDSGLWIGALNEQVYVGFIQWDWIKRIDISPQEEAAYIVLYDYNKAVKTFAFSNKMNVDMLLKVENGSEEAIVIPLSQFGDGDSIELIFQLITDRNFALINVIE